jgi:hypothetical protein
MQIFNFFADPVSSLGQVRDACDIIIEKAMNPYQECTIDDWRILGFCALQAGAADGVFSENFENLASEIAAVLVRKQTDYGHNNIARFGSTGLAVRVHDKIARLENLAAKGTQPENESLRDNFIDVIGYAAIGMMWEAGEFLLPLEKISPEVESPAFQ